MASLLVSKVVSALPSTLVADTIYYVRTGAGFDTYLTNHSGTIVAYTQNAPTVLGTLSSGGTTGQIIIKNSATAYDYSWQSNPALIAPSTTVVNGIVTYSATSGGQTTSAPMLSITSTGNLQTFGVGAGTVAGNVRGTNATDLQVSRTAATQIASGQSSFIGGGTNNTASGQWSVVAGGASNGATGATAVVVGGSSNSTAGTNSFIGGGNTNTISTNQQYSAILNGQNNSIGAGTAATNGYNFIASGASNSIAGAGSNYSIIVGGSTNQIQNGAALAFIGGGGSNIANGNYSVIPGGASNIMNSNQGYSIIAGGQSNYMIAGTSSSIGWNTISGGSSNQISGAGQSAIYVVIAGGQSHTISSSGTHNTISGGWQNSITGSGNYGTILGGQGHTLTGTAGVIVGGAGNNVSSTYGFAAGVYAVANVWGQRAFANNRWSVSGDAQISFYNLMAATSSTTPLVMTLDNTTPATAVNSITLKDAQTKFFYMNVLAQSTSAAGITGISVWEIKALVARANGVATIQLLGTPTNTQLFTSGTVTGWAVSLGVNTTLGSLTLTVTTGAATTAVKWLAYVQGTELLF